VALKIGARVFFRVGLGVCLDTGALVGVGAPVFGAAVGFRVFGAAVGFRVFGAAVGFRVLGTFLVLKLMISVGRGFTGSVTVFC
jgi:hypothetical protein